MGVTLDGINVKYIKQLALELKTEVFQFTSVKRVYISKGNGKTRPLGIPTIRDRLVQEAMRMLLEAIFEGKFSDLSHGFRPGRSCHTALSQVSNWNGITWMIEGDIKGFFDNVNHQILAKTLERYIKDQQFVDLYWKLVKAGYIDGGLKYNSYKGVPQGGIVSPVLSNIYLNEFDKFVLQIIEEYSSKNPEISKVNPKIVNYSTRLILLNDEYRLTKNVEKLKQLKQLRVERNKIPSRIRIGNRIWYVRYADDWVIGIIGKKELVETIKNLCKDFLKSQLDIELSEKKKSQT